MGACVLVLTPQSHRIVQGSRILAQEVHEKSQGSRSLTVACVT
jgi:hypothetical protein